MFYFFLKRSLFCSPMLNLFDKIIYYKTNSNIVKLLGFYFALWTVYLLFSFRLLPVIHFCFLSYWLSLSLSSRCVWNHIPSLIHCSLPIQSTWRSEWKQVSEFGHWARQKGCRFSVVFACCLIIIENWKLSKLAAPVVMRRFILNSVMGTNMYKPLP